MKKKILKAFTGTKTLFLVLGGVASLYDNVFSPCRVARSANFTSANFLLGAIAIYIFKNNITILLRRVLNNK